MSESAADSWTDTDFVSNKFHHTWNINYVENWKGNLSKKLVSSIFTFGDDPNCVCQLSLYREYPDKAPYKYASLFLNLDESPLQVDGTFHVSFKFGIKGRKSGQSEQKYRTTADLEYKLHSPRDTQGLKGWIPIATLLDEKYGYLVDGILTIWCAITTTRLRRNKGPWAAMRDSTLGRMLASDLGSILYEETFADVVLKCSDQEFKAHKTILGARSSVFKAMLTTEMIESKTNEISVPDFEPRVVKNLIRYVYTDEVPFRESPRIAEYEHLALELLRAADKYQMPGLRWNCEKYLSNCFTVGSVVGIAFAADLYGAKDLRALALQYIEDNLEGVLGCGEWKQYSRSNPELISGFLDGR